MPNAKQMNPISPEKFKGSNFGRLSGICHLAFGVFRT
jgi:hypothetical protein